MELSPDGSDVTHQRIVPCVLLGFDGVKHGADHGVHVVDHIEVLLATPAICVTRIVKVGQVEKGVGRLARLHNLGMETRLRFYNTVTAIIRTAR